MGRQTLRVAAALTDEARLVLLVAARVWSGLWRNILNTERRMPSEARKLRKVLVIGGAGYIGSAAAESLLTAGHTVTVYDSLVTGHRQAVPDGAKFIGADLGDRAALESALNSERYDAVMHFAAFIEAGESMKNPGKFLHNNLVNSLALVVAIFRARDNVDVDEIDTLKG